MSPARAARALRRAEAPEEAFDHPRRRPHLQVVDSPPTASRRRSRVPIIAGGFAVTTVFLALFGLVVFHTVLVQNQSKIDELGEQLTAEREQIKERRLEIAQLESPERVIAEAEVQGLIAPDEVVMLEAVTPEATTPDPEPGGTPGAAPGHEQAGAAPGDEATP